MKFIHLSDLHLGKRVNEFSLLEDQAHILEQILEIVRKEEPDGVLIAGDVYDKSLPPAEAVTMLDGFLVALAETGTQVFLISGNHDSPERLAFGGRLMEAIGIHLAPVYGGSVKPITLTDDYGPLDVYLLPFLRPAQVRRFFPEADTGSYTAALETAVQEMAPDPGRRNVLVTHQFVTGADRCESEDLSAGGTDSVSASVFDAFDYVALGHLHGPQSVGRETLRYCGTPLKYSFSEVKHVKSVTVVELEEKGSVRVRTVPLTPLREMVELRGTYEDLTRKGFCDGTTWQEDYVHITLTDEEDVPDAAVYLRMTFRGLMKLDYDNRRTRAQASLEGLKDVELAPPLELLEDFYQQQNGQPMSEEQRRFAGALLRELGEEEETCGL